MFSRATNFEHGAVLSDKTTWIKIVSSHWLNTLAGAVRGKRYRLWQFRGLEEYSRVLLTEKKV